MGITIMGGEFKGRKLATDSSSQIIRPTSGKVREALFSSLGEIIFNSTFVDLYAGSGSVGLEALSRGAFAVTLVEKNPKSWTLLKANIQAVAGILPNFKSKPLPVHADVKSFCRQMHEQKQQFDIVFADPPFADDFSWLKEAVLAIVSPGGMAIIQYPTKNPPIWAQEATKSKVYGESTLAYFKVSEDSPH